MPEVVTLENGRIKLRHRNDVKNSSWHYRFYFNQETIRKSTFTTNLDDAKQIAKDHYYECRNRVKTGLPIIDYKLRDVQEEFLKGFENKNISAKKQKDRKAYYRGMLKYWVELYGDRSLSQITQRNINDYLPWRLKYWTEGPGKNKKRHPRVKENPKDTTLGFEFGALRAVYSYALQQGYVAHGKIPTIKYDGGERGTRPALSLEQYKTISDAGYKWVDEAAGKPYHWKRWMTHHYFNIMTLTGLRVNEARYLKWGDIEPFKDKNGDQNIRLHVLQTKTRGQPKRRKAVPFMRASYWIWHLRTRPWHTADDDLVFCKRDGQPYRDFSSGLASV